MAYQVGNSVFSNAYNSRAKLVLFGKSNIEYWLKSYSLPSIAVEAVKAEAAQYDISKPGVKMEFGAFEAEVFIDEQFTVYDSLYNWIFNGTPWVGEDFVDPEIQAELWMLDNSLNSILKRFSFSGLFPTTIGSIKYDMFSSEEVFLSIPFGYSSFKPI